MDSITFNCDCLEWMKGYTGEEFNIAIVSPPSGSDCPVPDRYYFWDIWGISKNQIIFGANFHSEKLPRSDSWLVWDKVNKNYQYNDCVLAWTSFIMKTKIFKYSWEQPDMIHPHQMPVDLFVDILMTYGTPGQSVLDTHMGSGSLRIACDICGFDYTGIEIDKTYFDLQEKRYADYKAAKEKAGQYKDAGKSSVSEYLPGYKISTT